MPNEWNFKQELIACFGKPIAENPTQYMIESAFRHHGLNWRYINFETGPEDLANSIIGMRSMGFRGGNCTIPHKVAVIDYLDRLGESASLMHAVNCIVRDGDELIGENTDGKGFLSSLTEVCNPKDKSVVVLGAGGAARAICVELALAKVRRILVVNRSEERGRELVDLLKTNVGVNTDFVPWEGDYTVAPGTDVLINATSIGLFPDIEARVPLDLDSLQSGMVVADVIPNPPKTRLVRDATERGCTVLDGLGMLVNQGVIGFRLWTGVDPDARVMRAALEEVFGS